MLDCGWDFGERYDHIGDALLSITAVHILASLSFHTANDRLSVSRVAVGANKSFLVQWLLERGADPNANLCSETYTALEKGAMTASQEVLELLIAHGAKLANRRVLHFAASRDRRDIVELFLDKGASINGVPDNEDIAPYEALHSAVGAGAMGGVQLLLERGADKSIKDSRGMTARELALSRRRKRCAQFLE